MHPNQIQVITKDSRGLGQTHYAQKIYLPKAGDEIFAARHDLGSEREVILSTFHETSWGGCVMRNS